MRAKNIGDVLIYFSVVGALFVIVSGIWSFFFVITLPLSDGYCQKYSTNFVKAGADPVCAEWRSPEDRIIYEHNVLTRTKQNYSAFFIIIVGALLGNYFFYINPRRMGLFSHYSEVTESFILSIFIGVFTSFVIPQLLFFLILQTEKVTPDLVQTIKNYRFERVYSDLSINRVPEAK